MKDLSQNLTFIDLIRKLVAYKWRVIIITFAVTLIGTIYIISLPRGYTARTKIVVERKGNQNFGSLGVLGGLNLGSNLSDGLTIELAPAIVKSSSFLLEFYDMEVELMSGRKGRLAFSNYLENFQKKPWWIFFSSKGKTEHHLDTKRTKYELDCKHGEFMKSVVNTFSVITEKKTNVMTLLATTQDPLVSVILVDSLAKKLQTYLTSYQTSKAQQELKQWTKIADVARNRYSSYQERYANLMDQNQNLVTIMSKNKIDRLYNDMNIALQAYTSAASQVEIARTKLFENTPVYTVLEPPILDKSASYPNRKLIIVVSFLLGLFLGVGSVILVDIWKTMKPQTI